MRLFIEMAWRNIWRNWRRTAIATIAIALGLVLLIFMDALIKGSDQAVFERTREMGILAALGMKRRQIMVMFLFKSVILALVGIAVGIVLGSLGVAYLANVGIDIGTASAQAVEGIVFGTTLTGKLALSEVILLSLWMLVIILLVSLYPAWYAARLEPIEALHTL